MRLRHYLETGSRDPVLGVRGTLAEGVAFGAWKTGKGTMQSVLM